MAEAAKTWQDYDARRAALGISRAQMCRDAGISESTATVGLKRTTRPSRTVASRLEAALDAAARGRGIIDA